MSAETDTRQRLDYETLPNGDVKAILTVTLPGGTVKRFEAITTKAEAEKVEGEIVAGEIALSPEALTVVGWNPFKAVAKIAKKVANSKVFKIASTALAVAAPLLGPIAPAALGAAAAMGVASKLAKAGVAAAKGAGKVAAAITKEAASDAAKLTKTPEGAAQLLAVANKRRLGGEQLADKSPGPASESAAAPPPPAARRKLRPAAAPAAPTGAPMSSEALLARARAGRVRSNQPGPINPDQLLIAHKAGRIFWVS